MQIMENISFYRLTWPYPYPTCRFCCINIPVPYLHLCFLGFFISLGNLLGHTFKNYLTVFSNSSLCLDF